MDPERWRQIEDVYHSVCDRQGSERKAVLAAACDGDEELRREVESLLAQQSHDTALDRPVWDMAVGCRLGPYELLESIGSGGMGRVFRARDTRLNRSVAIKISAAQFSGRFANEARAVAALNHPHICTLHDVGTNYLVMEFVDGETLAERLGKGPLPLALTLEFGAQIADAVAAAHERGIIHRDLKPANIMLTKSGAKVLDFGLAKFEKPDAAIETQTASHAIVGTLAYMSPEQAEGKPVDARSDIFSLGAVLYEMAAGKSPFRRDTALATLAAVVKEDPEPLSAAVSGTPGELNRIVARCLRKDPARRFQAAADIKVELEDLREESASGKRQIAVAPQSRRRRWLWAGAIAAVVLLSATVIWRLREAVAPGELKSEVLTSYSGTESGPTLSPDGTKVAFSWNGEKEDNFDIYVKQIATTGTPMQLTRDRLIDCAPAWSPDDRWIAFLRIQQQQTQATIMLVPPLGGPERKLAEITIPILAVLRDWVPLSWTPDGKWIVYSAIDSQQTVPLSIWAISVETGERRRLTTFAPGPPGAETYLGDWSPSISPDGRTLAFARALKMFVYEIYTLRLTRDLRPIGQPARITDQRYGAAAGISWTADGGEIVYAAGSVGSTHLWRVPVSGRRTPERLPYALQFAILPAIARTGHRLVYTWWIEIANLWRMDIRTKERKMLTGSTYVSERSVYSPDSRKIAFQSNRSGNEEVWTCDADGANCQQLTFFGGPQCGTPRWSPDGQWLALDSRPEGQSEIYVIAADGGPLRRITDHPGDDFVPSWSHDGRWIYFTSDRSGRYELWKMAKEGGRAVQVTRSGGYDAFESRDGHIYYMKFATDSQPQSLFRMAVEGGAETRMLPMVRSVLSYGVTSKGIYFAPDAKTIQFHDFATSKVSTLVVLDKGERVGGDLGVSPDDAFVVWSQLDKSARDLMLVENFR